MEFGNVKWFNAEKGYGFIKPEGKGVTFLYILAHWNVRE